MQIVRLQTPFTQSISILKTCSFSLPAIFSPFPFLLFLYFSTTCAELLHIPCIIFKIKANFAIGSIMFALILISNKLVINQRYFSIFLYLLVCTALSTYNCANKIAAGGYLLFFIFTYFVYFVVPQSLLKNRTALLMNIYSQSFLILGCFALAQVLFSFCNIILPCVTQKIGSLARGQAWTYEPSFYALYMTPFISYENTKYFLTSSKKHLRFLFSNLVFLSSTSTGCFFSYLWMFTLLIYLLKKHKLKKWKTILIRFSFFLTSLFGLFAAAFPSGFTMMFKFFIGGFFTHGSFWCRWISLVRSWNIFLEHPLIGVGLGGVSPYTANKIYGLQMDALDPNIMAHYPSMNVTTEILASFGILGSLGFVYLFYQIYKDFKCTLQIPFLSKKELANVQAFAVSLCTTAFTYQFSQSIMRSYIWVHIALSIGYLYFLQSKYKISTLRAHS